MMSSAIEKQPQMYAFTAGSAAEAVQRIREELGSDAVVLNVKQVGGQGLSRLWQPKRIEVVACRAIKEPVAEQREDPLRVLKEELAVIRQRLSNLPAALPHHETQTAHLAGDGVEAVLVESGVLPGFARQLESATRDAGDNQMEAVQLYLRTLWARRAVSVESNVHVFVGPFGAGKTTCLCKWLAQAVLLENRLARVCRLDSATANTAESLSVFAEVLGVPVERFAGSSVKWNPTEMVFVDLPGVDWRSPQALENLRPHLAAWPDAHVHLVLNAAYDAVLLLAQAKAFKALPVTDVVFTHLDEEVRWGKLWNVWLGTNYTCSRLSGGQNIPGDFLKAEAELILARQFPHENAFNP
ncbi:MAG: hypothetical protein ACO1QS_17520 [Verrucomicrobiota bacterium]